MTAPTRVLYVAQGIGRGGAERQLVYWMRARPDGIEPMVCVTGHERGLEPELAAAGVPVRSVGEGSRAATLRALVRVARSFRPDICHSVHTVSNATTAAVARTAGGVPVGSVRNDWGAVAAGLGRLRSTLELHATGHLVVNSQRARRQVVAASRRPRQRTWYVPNVIDVDRFAPPARRPPAGDRLAVLSVGSLTAQKAHHRAIEVVAGLARDQPAAACELRIVGSGPLEGDLRARAASVQRSVPNVSIELAGARENVAPELWAADLLLLASDHEGTPNVVLEAMAAGLPVVATPVGDVPHLLRASPEGAGLADSVDVAALLSEARDLWGSPSLWRSVSDANLATVRSSHGLQRAWADLASVYHQVVA